MDKNMLFFSKLLSFLKMSDHMNSCESSPTRSDYTSFVRPTPSGLSTTLFGINHYAGSCTCDIGGFVERNADLLDSTFVSLLGSSTDSFVSKLVSGPSLAAETDHNDPNLVVQAWVSSRPLLQ